MWAVLFSVNSTNFQQWNSNLHTIFQIILRFKTEVFLFRSEAIHKNIESLDLILLLWDFTIFPVSESGVITGFYNVSLGCIPNFSQFTNELKNWYFWVPLTLIFCQIVRAIFQALYVWRRVNLWLNCQFSRKKMFTNVYAKNLCQFKYWEYYFQV